MKSASKCTWRFLKIGLVGYTSAFFLREINQTLIDFFLLNLCCVPTLSLLLSSGTFVIDSLRTRLLALHLLQAVLPNLCEDEMKK